MPVCLGLHVDQILPKRSGMCCFPPPDLPGVVDWEETRRWGTTDGTMDGRVVEKGKVIVVDDYSLIFDP